MGKCLATHHEGVALLWQGRARQGRVLQGLYMHKDYACIDDFQQLRASQTTASLDLLKGICACPCPACPALPCPALPCPALPCPALPCPALPYGLVLQRRHLAAVLPEMYNYM